MFFNSFAFAIFFSLIFTLYWVCRKSMKTQNALLLAGSFFFYACWNWRFVFLLIASILVCYLTGIKIDESRSTKRKYWLWMAVSVNLVLLGIFKYFNFFIDSFAQLLALMHFEPHLSTLNIVLPLGISFYTFHGLSYIFDIYDKKIEPTRNIVDYSLFVSFFPLLIAGPIERATHLLPQLKKERTFDYEKGVDGLRQILWGLFKKMVIADNCASIVNNAFDNYQTLNGSALIVAAILFSFQIYCDFSGYSDIAIGTARLLGFDLLKNFSFPYFSRDIAEFWRRWHISLTSWFKDYLYIPLGGSRGSTWMRVRNVFIVFVVSGFWHGANWTFIIWGLLNAFFILPSMLLRKNRKNLDQIASEKACPSLVEFCQLFITFGLVTFAWIFFRAKDLSTACAYLKRIVSSDYSGSQNQGLLLYMLIVCFILIEWFGRKGNYALEKLDFALKYRILRWAFYMLLTAFILSNTDKQQQFIYFTF